MAEHLPDAVLCIGQAGGRVDLTPERIAINQDDARIPDNEGQQPIDRTIREDGQPAYFSTLPIKAMVEAIHRIGLPASVSNTAGPLSATISCIKLFTWRRNNFQRLRQAFSIFPSCQSRLSTNQDWLPCL